MKDKILELFEHDENGRIKETTLLLVSSILIIPFIIYFGFKVGVYQVNHPKLTGLECVVSALNESFLYPFQNLENGFYPGYIIVFLAITIGVIGFSFIRIDRNKRKSDNSKGKAHWNNIRTYNKQFVYPKGGPVPKMVLDEKDGDEPGNMILGKINKNMPLCFDMHQKGGTNVYCNTLIDGSTGTGKSFGFVKPNIMQFNTSYVVTDPAGDLTRECGPALVHEGYNVKVFNVAEMKYSCRYNPFKYIRSEQDIKTMINVFMANTDDSEAGKGDQFFTKAEECLYLAMAFYIYTEYKDQPEKQTFNTMFEMYQDANASEDSKRENEVTAFDQRFIDLAKKDPYHPALKFYNIFKKGTGKTLKSILISAGVRLSFLAIPEVANLLSGDDLELETMGDKKQALFMIIKAEDATYNFISAMLFTQLFETQYYVAGQLNPNAMLLTKGTCTALKSRKVNAQQMDNARAEVEAEREIYKQAVIVEEDPDDEKFRQYDEEGFSPYPRVKLVLNPGDEDEIVLKEFLGRKEAEIFMDCINNGKIAPGKKHLTSHLRFILDEFANIGKIPDFDKKIATFRKYWISSDIIIQSIGQLKKMYEDNIGIIVSNCNIIICLGTTDKEDSEFFSELLGQKTVDVISRSFDNKGGFTGSSGGNISNDAENLMRPEDVRAMKPDECIVFISTQQPFKCKKFPATEHPNYKLLYDDHKSPESKDYVPPFEYQRIYKVKPIEQVATIVEPPAPKEEKRTPIAQQKRKRQSDKARAATPPRAVETSQEYKTLQDKLKQENGVSSTDGKFSMDALIKGGVINETQANNLIEAAKSGNNIDKNGIINLSPTELQMISNEESAQITSSDGTVADVFDDWV